MDVFFETESGSTFCMKLGYWYTVLEIKQNIEKSQRIPVSKQTLFFKGKVLQDDLDVEECVILHNSRIQLVISPDNNPNPNNAQVPQTTQESNSIGDIFEAQDWSLTDEEFRNMQQFCAEEPINVQDSPVVVGSNNNNNNQVLQTEQYPQLNSAGQFINVQDSPGTHIKKKDSPGMVGSYRNMQQFWPEEPINVQDWPMVVGSNKNNNQVLQTEQYPQLNSAGQFINVQDLAGMVGSYRNDQVFHQSPLPSNSIYGQDFALSTANIQQHWPLTAKEITPVLQTEQSPSSNSTGDIVYSQDWPYTPKETMHIQQYWPVTIAENSPVMMGSNQVLQTEQIPPLSSPQQFIDFPVPGLSNKNNNHMLQTEQSPASNSVKEVINIPESPVTVKRSNNRPPRKLRVMVMPHPQTRKIPVEVNARDNVEELRKELVKIEQKFELNLPKDGYFFIHKQSVMDEDRSFWWNGVDPGDTIDIFPGTVTRGSVERGAY